MSTVINPVRSYVGLWIGAYALQGAHTTRSLSPQVQARLQRLLRVGRIA